MLRFLLLLLVVAWLIGVPVARRVRRVCRRSPGYRPWVVAGATALLIGVAFAVPHLDQSIPGSMRESPAGLIPFVGAVVGLCLTAILAISAIAGAILPSRGS